MDKPTLFVKIIAIVVFSFSLIAVIIGALFIAARYVVYSDMHSLHLAAQNWLDAAPTLIFGGVANGLGIALVLVPVLAVVLVIARE